MTRHLTGHPTTQTPNIDALAHGGKILTSWYVTNSPHPLRFFCELEDTQFGSKLAHLC